MTSDIRDLRTRRDLPRSSYPPPRLETIPPPIPMRAWWRDWVVFALVGLLIAAAVAGLRGIP